MIQQLFEKIIIFGFKYSEILTKVLVILLGINLLYLVYLYKKFIRKEKLLEKLSAYGNI